MRAESKCADKERMEALRKSLLEKVLSYTGVPYARRYHEPTCKPPTSVGSRSPFPRTHEDPNVRPLSAYPSSHLPLQIVSGLLRAGAPGDAGPPGGVWIYHWTREPGLSGSQGGGAAVEGVSLLCYPCAQFDTLPIALRGPEEMQPGDLVFVSAVYYNTKSEWQC